MSTLKVDNIEPRTGTSITLAGGLVLPSWVTSTSYTTGMMVLKGNTVYICISDHTSGTFATDWLTNSYWVTNGSAPGTVTMLGKSTTITGHLLCDGSAVSRTTYADLFAVIGTTYGAGDTTTTFNLPDFRGVYPKGAGTTNRAAGKDASGNFYAATLGTYTTDKMQGHYHTIKDMEGGGGSLRNYTVSGSPQTNTGAGIAVDLGVLEPITDGTNDTPRTGHTTEPQNLGITFIIKY